MKQQYEDFEIKLEVAWKRPEFRVLMNWQWVNCFLPLLYSKPGLKTAQTSEADKG